MAYRLLESTGGLINFSDGAKINNYSVGKQNGYIGKFDAFIVSGAANTLNLNSIYLIVQGFRIEIDNELITFTGTPSVATIYDIVLSIVIDATGESSASFTKVVNGTTLKQEELIAGGTYQLSLLKITWDGANLSSITKMVNEISPALSQNSNPITEIEFDYERRALSVGTYNGSGGSILEGIALLQDLNDYLPASGTAINSNALQGMGKSTNGYNGFIYASSDGVAEIGKYMDFHATSTDTKDYDVRFVCPALSIGITVNLPSTSGTLAITSQIPTKTSQLTNNSGFVYETRNVNGKALSSDITITKSDVGLGDVVNTGDSATPVSGGITKFTTGGAYTELAKKQDVLKSGSNIKTINNNSILGSGNITIEGTITLSNDWVDVGSNSINLSSGIYMICIEFYNDELSTYSLAELGMVGVSDLPETREVLAGNYYRPFKVIYKSGNIIEYTLRITKYSTETFNLTVYTTTYSATTSSTDVLTKAFIYYKKIM